jgi:hypothetical protein
MYLILLAIGCIGVFLVRWRLRMEKRKLTIRGEDYKLHGWRWRVSAVISYLPLVGALWLFWYDFVR